MACIRQGRGIDITLEINLCKSIKIYILFIVKRPVLDYFMTILNTFSFVLQITFFFIIFQSFTFFSASSIKGIFYYFLWGEITTRNIVGSTSETQWQFWNPYEKKKLCEFVSNEIIKYIFFTINNVRFYIRLYHNTTPTTVTSPFVYYGRDIEDCS